MKNAYALAVTLAVGMAEKRDGKLHYNSQAALFAQSVREMRRLLKLVGGADENIVYGAGEFVRNGVRRAARGACPRA